MKNLSSTNHTKTLLTRLNALKLFLVTAAAGWGICIVGFLVPTNKAFYFLSCVGGVDVAPMSAEPMFAYWLRMAASTFTFIGCGYLVLALNPRKYAALLPFAGAFSALEGLILLGFGTSLHLESMPYLGDVSFCLVCGCGILLTMRAARA